MSSLTPTMKVVIAITVVVLVAGFWYGWRGSGSSAPDREVTWEASETSVPIMVHVVGAVRNPGVYRLTAGARVSHAIAAAGGFAPGAKTASVNLAALCTDGQQIVVESSRQQASAHSGEASAPAPQQRPTAVAPPQSTGGASSHAARTTGRSSSSPARGRVPARASSDSGSQDASEQSELPAFARGTRQAPVRLNYAGLEELQTLPGIGPTLAKRIIYHRRMNGPFRSFDELQEVEGIGSATIEELRIQATLR